MITIINFCVEKKYLYVNKNIIKLKELIIMPVDVFKYFLFMKFIALSLV